VDKKLSSLEEGPGTRIIQEDEGVEKDYNLEVFDRHIVYSTNYVFECVILYSLFSGKQLRSRPYDVIIVDEVR